MEEQSRSARVPLTAPSDRADTVAGAATRSVEIVGAGPAGLSAAIAAVGLGASVVVYEKKPDVGARFHGDFQGLENWTSETDVVDEIGRLGIDVGGICKPVREVVCFEAGGSAHVLRSARPIFYLVSRGSRQGTLDQALKALACAAGVGIRFNQRRNHVTGGAVIAEGPHRADVIATGYVFETDMPDGCYAVVSDRLAFAGYAYLLVDGGRGTVATCLFGRFHDEARYLDATVDFFKREAGLRWQTARRFGGSGNYDRVQRAFGGNRLYAGEAAGFQDALFGFGLRYAMLSGFLAGRAVALGEDYGTSWWQRIGAWNRASLVNRWIYARMGDMGRQFFLTHYVARRDPRRLLHRIYAPSRWKAAASKLISSKRPLFRDCPKAGCDCTWCRCHRIGTQPTADHA